MDQESNLPKYTECGIFIAGSYSEVGMWNENSKEKYLTISIGCALLLSLAEKYIKYPYISTTAIL